MKIESGSVPNGKLDSDGEFKNSPLEVNFVEPNGTPPNKDDKKNKKSKKKKKDDDEDKDSKSTAPEVSFFSLYRYSTAKDRIMIFTGILGGIITGLCTPANTFIFGRLADSMIQMASEILSPPEGIEPPIVAAFENETIATAEIDMEALNEWFMDEIHFFVIFNTGIGAVMLVFSYISIMLFNYAAHNQIFTIRSRFLKSALNQDITWYDLNQSGEFSSRMNEDLSKLGEGLGEKVVMFVHYFSAFLSSLILAFILGWELALICLTSLPVTLISFGAVSIITSKMSKQEMEEYAKASSVAEEVFSAIRTVFAFGGQDKESVRYKSKLTKAKTINIKKQFFTGLGFGLLWFFIYASYALAFWYGIGLVLDHNLLDDPVYTPAVMFTVFFSVMMASMNLGIGSPLIETFGIAKGAGAKVFETIERIPQINTLSPTGLRPTTVEGNISFQGVHFKYPSRVEVPILQGLTFDVTRGQTVALVGSSGCGKSTCIQLIQRFYDPDEGQVKLDGENIKDLNVSWLRSKIGVVGQEPVLFGTTISENIRFGKEDATRDEIEAAAKSANAHNFIKKLPNGYETMVGERGAQMSGGQKQRIAIARALIRNPEILLLDEATSALDTVSESKVQAALETAAQGRTTIIVAHRLSTIRNADKIVVLDQGRVAEQGTHAELISIHGHYHKLVTSQCGTDDDMTVATITPKLNAAEIIDEDDKDVVDLDDKSVDEAAAPKISLRQVMRWNKTEWPYIVVGSVCSVIMGGAMPLFALIFGELLGIMAGIDDDPDFVRSESERFSLYFVIVGIVVGLATFLQIYTYGIAGEILTQKLRAEAFTAMLRQEIGWFDDKSNGTGTLTAKLSGDAAAVQGATGQRIGTVLQSFATIAIAIGIAMYYEWRLAFLAMAFFPFIVIASYFEIKVMEQENLGNSKALEQSTKLAVEVVSNIRTVVSLGREQMFHTKYVSYLLPSLAIAKRNTHFRGFVYGIARSLMFFAYAACMFLGGYLVANHNVEIQAVFVTTQALIMGSLTMANALAFAPNFQKGLTAAGKINHLFNRQPKIQDPVPVTEENSRWTADGDVEYRDVEFFYPSRPTALVLDGLNIDIDNGQTVALVGPSGCGKSTCIQLLERFYDSTGGNVEIDKRNVTSVTLSSLRSQLGIVSQEPSLFDRTIAENIAYGDNSRQVSQDEVITAAKNANIHTFITSLPLGYDTRLGDRGTQLSGGQKQRVAIARALVRNPKILLLDEATSALDTESERIVQEALDAAKEGRTCITIAHRLTTIVDADVIVVIDGGIVAERGTHKKLIEQQGIYYNLWKLQSGAR